MPGMAASKGCRQYGAKELCMPCPFKIAVRDASSGKTENKSCDHPIWDQSRQWGFPIEICQFHFIEELGKVAHKLPGKKDSLFEKDRYLRDWTKIWLMFQYSKPTIENCLRQLAEKWQRKLDTNNFKNSEFGASKEYIKLSELLAKYERICWFPASHDVFCGFLETVDFDRSIAQGIMAKDPGASVNHGDFTHRLQWHAIMSVITNEFTTARRSGWDNSPLALYTACGNAPYDGKNNIWFQLFDNNHQSDFRSPDWTNLHVRTGDYGLVSTAVAQRHDKRLREYMQFDTEPTLGEGRAVVVNSNTKAKYEEAFNQFRNYYQTKKQANPKQGKFAGSVLSTPYGGKPNPDFDSMPLSARINASQMTLNTSKNKYSKVLGPVRAPGQDDSVSRFAF
jgi:hypothetical protein